MHERKSFSQRADEFLSGKGFYIVLFACVAIIGVSAWLLLFSRWSPLSDGDEGDYLDVMGDVSTTPPQDDTTAGGADTTGKTAGTGKKPDDTTAPGGLTQELNKPGTDDKNGDKSGDKTDGSAGALTVTDKTGGDTTDEPEDGPAKAKTVKDLTFMWPVSGEVIKGHSPDELVYSETLGDWRVHDGLDIAARLGTRVLSCADGTVKSVEDSGDGRGTVVVIDHGAGVIATYANLAGTPTVKAGDSVTLGSVIGSVGATSLYETAEDSHLHFAMTIEGKSVDPAQVLPRK